MKHFIYKTSLICSIVFFLFSGCEKIEQGYNPSGGNLPTNYISIKDGSFYPSTITLAGGNSITFLNSTSTIHQIVSDDLLTINTGNIQSQKSYYWKKDIQGTINYHCVQHPNVRGIIILTP